MTWRSQLSLSVDPTCYHHRVTRSRTLLGSARVTVLTMRRRQGRDPARKRVRRAPSPFLARRPLLRLQLGRARPERGLRAPFPHDRRGVARFDGRGAATEWSRDGKEIFFLTLDGR